MGVCFCWPQSTGLGGSVFVVFQGLPSCNLEVNIHWLRRASTRSCTWVAARPNSAVKRIVAAHQRRWRVDCIASCLLINTRKHQGLKHQEPIHIVALKACIGAEQLGRARRPEKDNRQNNYNGPQNTMQPKQIQGVSYECLDTELEKASCMCDFAVPLDHRM